MEILTPQERKALNDAMDVLARHTQHGSSWVFGPGNYKTVEPPKFSDGGAAYFDTTGAQHSGLPGETFADRIEAALQIEQAIEKDAAIIRARQIELLRNQLQTLEQAA